MKKQWLYKKLPVILLPTITENAQEHEINLFYTYLWYNRQHASSCNEWMSMDVLHWMESWKKRQWQSQVKPIENFESWNEVLKRTWETYCLYTFSLPSNHYSIQFDERLFPSTHIYTNLGQGRLSYLSYILNEQKLHRHNQQNKVILSFAIPTVLSLKFEYHNSSKFRSKALV